MDRWDRSERSISLVLGAKFDESIWIDEAGDSYFGMITSEKNIISENISIMFYAS